MEHAYADFFQGRRKLAIFCYWPKHKKNLILFEKVHMHTIFGWPGGSRAPLPPSPPDSCDSVFDVPLLKKISFWFKTNPMPTSQESRSHRKASRTKIGPFVNGAL